MSVSFSWGKVSRSKDQLLTVDTTKEDNFTRSMDSAILWEGNCSRSWLDPWNINISSSCHRIPSFVEKYQMGCGWRRCSLSF